MKKRPIVMTFSGHDPSGGAGIQADIETLSSQGCLATTIITALTVQDSRDVTEFRAIDASHIISQARAVLEDMPVAAFKIGIEKGFYHRIKFFRIKEPSTENKYIRVIMPTRKLRIFGIMT